MMAVRAKSFSDAKTQSASNLELFWWVFMRISGVALVFLALGHLYIQNVLLNPGEVDYDFVAERLSQTTWKLYDWLLLSLALLHGTNGTRYVIDDYIHSAPVRFWVKAVFYSLVVLLFAMGSLVLFNYNFEA